MKAHFRLEAWNPNSPSANGLLVEIERDLPSIPAPGTRFGFVGPNSEGVQWINALEVRFSVPDQCVEIDLSPEYFGSPDSIYSFANANGADVKTIRIESCDDADDLMQ